MAACSEPTTTPARTARAQAQAATSAPRPPASTAPAATTTVLAPPLPSAPPASIGTTVLRLVDTSRPTVSHGRLVTPSRTVTTEVWYPEGSAGPHPLVVFAHGYRLGVAPYRRACLALARQGFVVAAPTFTLSDEAAAGPLLDEHDNVNEPADVSFVITQLLGASAAPGEPLGGQIDPSKIAVFGHSDGATVAIELAFLPTARDPRVRLIVADAPSALVESKGTPPLTGNVPLLLIHGDHDTIAPVSGSLQLMTQIRTPGWFLLLRGAGHLPPIEGPSEWTDVFDRVSSGFIRAGLDGRPDLGAVLIADVAGAPASLSPLKN